MVSAKKKCEKCGILLRNKALVKHKPTGEKRCKRCIAKFGNHKTFGMIPIFNKNYARINDYNIIEQEKKVLMDKHKNWKKVKKTMDLLQKEKKKNWRKQKEETQEKKQTKETDKKFKKEFDKLE